MHLFSFWTQQYAHRAVTLQDCEVAFVDIPRHSAHIYSVSLTTDPTLPKYVGSNLHFSCGSELHRSCMLKTNPGEAEEYLKNAFSRRLEEENCAFSMPNTPREVDFAHEFGIAGLSNNNSNNNSNSKVSPVPVPEGSPASPCSPRPVVRTLLLSFETSALKNAHFGGAVWVFLPVNGASKAMVGTSFSQVVVQGPASAVAPSTHFPSEMYGGGMYGVGGDISSPLQPEHEPFLPSHSRSRHHTTATPASSRRGIGSADFTTTATESSSVHRVARVSAPDCRTHGSVFRIPVVRSSNSNCNSNIGNSRGNGGASGGGRGGGSSGEGSGGGGEGGSRGEGSSSSSSISHDHHNQITDAAEGRDYITISWVFDVLDA